MTEDIKKALTELNIDELAKVQGFIMNLINIRRIREIVNRPAIEENDYHKILKDLNDLLDPQRLDYDV